MTSVIRHRVKSIHPIFRILTKRQYKLIDRFVESSSVCCHWHSWQDHGPAARFSYCDRLGHVSTLYPTLPIVELAERLARITPGRLQKTYFTASGTEADETAVALAQVYTGAIELQADFWDIHAEALDSWQANGRTFYALESTDAEAWYPNEFVYTPGDDRFEAVVRPSTDAPGKVRLEVVRDYRSPRNIVDHADRRHAQVDSSGVHQWHTVFHRGGSGQDVRSEAIFLDQPGENGGAFLTGIFAGLHGIGLVHKSFGHQTASEATELAGDF